MDYQCIICSTQHTTLPLLTWSNQDARSKEHGFPWLVGLVDPEGDCHHLQGHAEVHQEVGVEGQGGGGPLSTASPSPGLCPGELTQFKLQKGITQSIINGTARHRTVPKSNPSPFQGYHHYPIEIYTNLQACWMIFEHFIHFFPARVTNFFPVTVYI